MISLITHHSIMNPGDQIKIQAVVLRVEGDRVDAQTANGQLIQTDIENVAEHKAILNAPENKGNGKQTPQRKDR